MQEQITTSEIKLICLDFDGTILIYDDEEIGHFHPDVITLLNSLEEKGIVWCANSGRDKEDQLAVIERAKASGLTHMPVALVCSESFIYMKNGSGYYELEPWNTYAREMLRDCHTEVQKKLCDKFVYIEETYTPISSLVGECFTAFFIPDRDNLPGKLFDELKQFTEGVGNIMITRNGGWVTVMHVMLGKGNALKEFMRHRGLESCDALTVGDHLNDLTMLKKEIAHYLGCPGNAAQEVKDAVRTEGGIVADEHGALGTIQIIRSCLQLA